MENPIKMDDFGVPLFLETPTWGLGGFHTPPVKCNLRFVSSCVLKGGIDSMGRFGVNPLFWITPTFFTPFEWGFRKNDVPGVSSAQCDNRLDG